MLKTLQIIAILQGLFLLMVLFQRKKDYKTINFWLLFSCFVSVLLFAIGDDDYHLFLSNTDWFFFHEPLIITTLFLFVKYYDSNANAFHKRDLIYVIPYFIHLSFNGLEILLNLENQIVLQILQIGIDLIFTTMLCYTIYDVVVKKKEKWLLAFIVPLTIIFIIDEFADVFSDVGDAPLFLDSYGMILMAVCLFYFVLYKLTVSPKAVLPKSQPTSYKASRLTASTIETIKTKLNTLMTQEKRFKNKKLSVDEVAKELGINRQQLSEVLNIHMNVGFQDYLNQFRVEEFIHCLQSNTYNNYTLLAIAQEVGFSSKTAFNTSFKRLKGMTPSAYKKALAKT